MGLDNRAMCTLHAVLVTEEGPNLIRYDVLPISCRQHIAKSAHLPLLDDENGRILQLLGMVALRLSLGNSHFRVPRIVIRNLSASMIIDTAFLDGHFHPNRFMEGFFETISGTVFILSRNRATIDAVEA